MRSFGHLLAASLALLAATAAARAEEFTRVAIINGLQEVPPNASTATGWARCVVDTTANTVTYRIVYAGLGSAETAAHFHGTAGPGVNAPVLNVLPAGPVKVGVWNYPEPLESDILTGGIYINIHSGMLPGGEIRGQVVSAVCELDGGQEVPPNGSAGQGFGLFDINTTTDTLRYHIVMGGLGSPENAAHIHGFSLPGTNSGVVHPLPLGNVKTGVWNYPPANEQAIIDGMTYVNIHSNALPGGEIRGQIIFSVNPMDALQENPPVPSNATGVTLASFNRGSNNMGFDVRVRSLSSAETAAHIHGFAPPGMNAGVLLGLAAGPVKRGTWFYGPGAAANVFAGLAYTNIHSVNFGGGELRGQILQPKIVPCSPLITANPTDVTVIAPASATFMVNADPRGGGPPNFQWRRNGTPVPNSPPFFGSTTGTLTINPTDPALAGFYDVVVSNTCGGNVSEQAELIVLTVPPQCDPDFNCDGNADQDDVACMIDVVAGNPGCQCQDPDFNQDGNVDQDDVAALINVVAGGPCP